MIAIKPFIEQSAKPSTRQSVAQVIKRIDFTQIPLQISTKDRMQTRASGRTRVWTEEALPSSREFQKHYVIFAGVDGSGKSSLYHGGLWWNDSLPGPKHMERVNIGEVLWQNGGDRDSSRDRQNAAKVVAEKVEDCFARGVSFNHETTFTEEDCLQNIKRALALGYGVYLYYVGANCSESTRGRVAYRKRSRNSLPAVMKQKYEASLRNLRVAMGMCHETYLFDNSYQLALVKAYKRGRLVFNGENPQVAWTREY